MDMAGLAFPAQRKIQEYMVNLPGTVETIQWQLYDIVTYGTGGFTTQTFFQRAVGQGGITKSSTNMVTPGTIPRGQEFLITSIEVELYSAPADLAVADGVAPIQVEEYYEVMTAAAHLQLTIGSKPYALAGPLLKFAPKQRIKADISVAANDTTANTATTVATGLAQVVGETYDIVPLLLIPNQNFDIQIAFDSAVAVTTAARMGVTLNGYLTRNAQ